MIVIKITGLLNIRKLIKFIDDQDGITIDKIRDTVEPAEFVGKWNFFA